MYFLIKCILNNSDLTSIKLLNGDCQSPNMEKIAKILTKKTKLSGGELYARIR